MKYLICIGIILLCNQTCFSQCTVSKDCTKIPFTEGCERFCANQLTILFFEASENELSLLVGLEEGLINKIIEGRNAQIPKNQLEKFYTLFNTEEKAAFTTALQAFTTTKQKYFALPDGEKKKFRRALGKA